MNRFAPSGRHYSEGPNDSGQWTPAPDPTWRDVMTRSPSRIRGSIDARIATLARRRLASIASESESVGGDAEAVRGGMHMNRSFDEIRSRRHDRATSTMRRARALAMAALIAVAALIPVTSAAAIEP